MMITCNLRTHAEEPSIADTPSAMRPAGDGDFLRGEQHGTGEMGSDHGLTKCLYKVGVTDEDPAAAIERFNAEQHAG